MTSVEGRSAFAIGPWVYLTHRAPVRVVPVALKCSRSARYRIFWSFVVPTSLSDSTTYRSARRNLLASCWWAGGTIAADLIQTSKSANLGPTRYRLARLSPVGTRYPSLAATSRSRLALGAVRFVIWM